MSGRSLAGRGNKYAADWFAGYGTFPCRVIRDDQVADVRIARGDDAREWRSHAFKCDLLFENTKVGGEGICISLGRLLVGGCVVGVELGDDAFVP
jgi:hypothetical protein